MKFVLIPVAALLALVVGFGGALGLLIGVQSFIPPQTMPTVSAATAPTPAPTSTPVPTPTAPRVQPPTLAAMFQGEGTPPAGLDQSRIRTMVVTGDVIPARYTNYKLSLRNDWAYPFTPTLPILTNADFSFINLEAPLMKNCPIAREGYVFCGNARFMEGLKDAKVDVVNLANNHAHNFGQQGIDETTDLLKAAGMGWTGLGSPYYMELRGMKIAFLGYSGVIVRFDRETMRTQIAEARKQVGPGGLVVVQTHWGKEYVSIPDIEPGVSDDQPREIGRLIIDSGADIVIGNHPHWVQGVELYKDRLITYAHGNFIFDQNFSRETREGVIGKYTFYDNQLVAVKYFPVLIDDYTQPRPLSGGEAEAVLKRMRDASLTMAAMPFKPGP